MNSGTLDTALELPVTVEYDCVDEEAIEITRIVYAGVATGVIGSSSETIDSTGMITYTGPAIGSEVFVKDITQIQYDSLIDQINADLSAQKVEADEFLAESMRDDSKHNPNW